MANNILIILAANGLNREFVDYLWQIKYDLLKGGGVESKRRGSVATYGARRNFIFKGLLFSQQLDFMAFATTNVSGKTASNDFLEGTVVDSSKDWRYLLSLNKPVFLANGHYSYVGTVFVKGRAYIDGDRNAKIFGLTEASSDFGLSLTDEGSLKNLKIKTKSNAAGVVNGRSNAAVVLGAQQATSNEKSEGWSIENVFVQLLDVNRVVGNTVAGFGDVSRGRIRGLDIDTNARTGLQFHWGYGVDGYSKHPRNIVIDNVTVNGLQTRTTGVYLSGCHDVDCRRIVIKGCNQGVIVGAGDVGGGANPDPKSKNRVMSQISLVDISVHNSINDPLLLNGASFVLGASRSSAFPNQRWIGADYDYTGLLIRNFRVIRGADSSNSSCSIYHMRNVDAQISTALGHLANRTDTHEALTLTSVCDSSFVLETECVVAANIFSGKNNKIHISHRSSDVNNFRRQNAVVVRGSIVECVVRNSVPIGSTSLILSSLTCDIHRGMIFEYLGAKFEFDSHARFDNGRSANNFGVKVFIKPAVMEIPSGGVIEQYYCSHDISIVGRISGAYKGVRVVSSDSRVPFNIEINADFDGTIGFDIEVPNGIRIKRNGIYYYNDTGGAMTFFKNQPVQEQVISYKEINGHRIGFSNRIPKSGGEWPLGSLLRKRSQKAELQTGWICVVAGLDGNAVWKDLSIPVK